jgi:DNA-binding FadR family transcriptional regulator
MSKQLGVGISSLREQAEAAKALGLLEAKPRTGMRRLRFEPKPAILTSLSYGVRLDPGYFRHVADLRAHLEDVYWSDAVPALTAEDVARLSLLVDQAERKLASRPVQIPYREHRELHLLVFCRLENPIVTALLETYWDLYEAVGLDIYADLDYLERVWGYHRRIVERIEAKDYDEGHRLLLEHMTLIDQRANGWANPAQ